MPHSDHDALTVALRNPEHGGRSRGQEFGYGKTETFGTQSRGPSGSWVSWEDHIRLSGMVVDLTGKLDKMSQMLEDLLAARGSSVADIAIQPQEPPSTRGSHSPDIAPGAPGDDHDLEDGMSRLYVDPGRFVGWGTLYRDRASFHCVPVPPDHVVVEVVKVEAGAGDAPLPCPEKGEAEMVEKAASAHVFVLWPYRLIDMKVYMLFHYVNVLIQIFVNYRIS